MGDPSGAFTKACDQEMTHPGPVGVGIIGRCKRWAMIVEDNVVKGVAVAENLEFDPAGDEFPEKTLAPALIEMATDSVKA
jgi:peroxiredoxin